MSRTEIRITGFGGQGVITAGVFLGNAAVIHDGKKAIQTQSYGAAARGGASRSDVIISEEPIIYPQVTKPDIMIAFTQEALKKYQDELRENAVLILDKDLVKHPEGTNFDIHMVPATHIAANDLGRTIVANMIMLGYLVKLTGVVSVDAMEKTIRKNVPRGTDELNISAFRKGMELAEKGKNE